MVKPLLIITGWTAVILGVIGIFLPLFPTTPFLLLAAWCFYRSSEKFHTWLIEHKILGSFITRWTEGNLSRQQSFSILSGMWLSFTFSMLTLSLISPLSQHHTSLLNFCLIGLGCLVSLYIEHNTEKTA